MQDIHKRFEFYKQFREQVESKGHILVTSALEWKNQRNHVDILCPNNHLINILPYDFLKNKIPCSRCSGYRKTLEDVQALALKLGWKFLEDHYKNDRTPYRWRCPNGHIHIATHHYFTKCQSCKECQRMSYTLIDYVRAAKVHDWHCRTSNDKRYSAQSLLSFTCSKGHEFRATYASAIKGQCNECLAQLEKVA